MSHAETIEAFGKLGATGLLALAIVTMVWLDFQRENRLVEVVHVKMQEDARLLNAIKIEAGRQSDALNAIAAAIQECR